MAVRTIAFDQGQNQGIESKLLDGGFNLVRNGVLAIDGQLRPRPGFTALASTVYGSGSFVAYDLFSYGERLCAFGDSTGAGYATDIFELVDGAAAAWHPTVPSPTVPRLPRATGVRDLPQPPDQQDGVISFGCAAFGGFTCLAWNNADTSTPSGFALVQSAETGQVICFEQFPGGANQANELLRVIELDDRFVLIGKDSSGTSLCARRFTPASDESFFNVGELTDDAVNYTLLAAARAEGSTQFVTVTSATTAGVLRTRRWSNAGVNQVPSGGQYANITEGLGAFPDRLEVHASSTDNRITLGVQTNGVLHLHTFNLTTGAAVGAGPFTPFSGDTVDEFALCTGGTNIVYVVATVTGGTTPVVKLRSYNTSTNAFGTVKVVNNARLASTPILDGSELVFAVRCGPDVDSQSNSVIAVHVSASNATTPLISKDFEASTSASAHIPNLTKDSSTGLWYWANAALSSDTQPSPKLTEFEMGSAERRQTCQIGAHVFIAGGVPLIYDGTQLFECGFLDRPRIISVTPDTGTGELLGGATYLYKTIWEALDADDNIWRSCISLTSEVEMGPVQDENDVVCETPYSMRLNSGAGAAGSVVRVKLYRTVAVADSTPAILEGTQPADPPTSSVVGQFLGLYINDSTGGQFFGITFSALATSSLQIASEINAVTTGRIAADGSSGRIVLTSVDTGESVFMFTYPDPAALTLGIPTTTAQGTTTFTQGDVFHLCATAYTALGAEVGETVTITDRMSDDELREQQIIYTQVDGPVEHFAPGPADLCSSGGSQVAVAGQPRRDRWTISKPFAPAQGPQFANPGREKFSQRIRQDIEAIIQRDAEHLLLTSREIWQVTGEGPDRAARGEFARPRLVYGEGGLKRPRGWRSVITVTDGTFFQLDDDKLYALSPGSGPQWIGHPVLQTLRAYPTIAATCHVKGMQTLVFACINDDGTEGVLLRYDLRRKQWFEDDVGPVTAVAEHQGRLAVVIAGVVYLQDTEASGTLPTLTARLGDFLNFGAVGYGSLTDVLALLTYQGDCDVELQQALGGSQTWVTCGTFELRAANYSQGDPVELHWAPALDECTRFALQLIISSASTDSAGAWAHALEVHTDKQSGPARLSESRRR